MTAADASRTVPRRLAILSFSSGEFDARSFRLAASAIAAGWEVVVYSRWYPGLPGTEERDGYQLVRIDADPRQALPLVGGIVRRRRRAAVARAKVVGTRTDLEPSTTPPSVATRATGTSAPRRRFTGNPLTWPVRFSRRKIREVRRMLGRWRTALLMFPLRPLGWARAVEEVADPADVWHGMWAGSLPALVRLQRRHGGRTLYDSRDVYMLSRSFMHLEWPVRPMLERLERRWAHQVDQVLTVNEGYADLIARQLRIPRPPVVLNASNRWTPPDPRPDLVRQAIGIPADTAVVLYQGQLMSQRGIEQAMQAILEVPGAVLVLLGYGVWQEHLARNLHRAAVCRQGVRTAGRPTRGASELDSVRGRDGDADPAQLDQPRVHHAPEAMGGYCRRRTGGGIRPAGDGGDRPNGGAGGAVRPDSAGVHCRGYPLARGPVTRWARGDAPPRAGYRPRALHLGAPGRAAAGYL